MKLAIDMDGVLANFISAACKLMTSSHPTLRFKEGFEPNEWDFISKEDQNWLWRTVEQTSDFWIHIPPYMDNVLALRKFLSQESGHEVYFLTSRAAGKIPVAIQTDIWLDLHGIKKHNNYAGVVVVPKSDRKAAVVEAMKIDASVDDYGPTVEMLSKIKHHKAFLMDRPWNRDKDYGVRVHSMADFLEASVNGKTPTVC